MGSVRGPRSLGSHIGMPAISRSRGRHVDHRPLRRGVLGRGRIADFACVRLTAICRDHIRFSAGASLLPSALRQAEFMSMEMPNMRSRARRLRFAGAPRRRVGVLAGIVLLALMAAPVTALGQGAAAASRRPAATSLPGIGGLQLPRDLSPWNMFMSADIVVKAVMIGLAFASVVTWTVWLAKNIELWAAKRRVRAALASDRRRAIAGRGADACVEAQARHRADAASMRPSLELQLVLRRRRQGTASRSASPRGWTRLEVRGRPRHEPRHRRARDHRLHGALRRPVRHRVGHHEQLHRHLQGADDQPRRRRAGHRRGAAGDRHRPVRRHSRRRSSTISSRAPSRATGRWSATPRPRCCASCRAISIAASGRSELPKAAE